jgi:hypothetical protein
MAGISREKAKAANAEAQAVFERIGEVMGIGITKIGEDYDLKVNLRAPSRAKRRASAPYRAPAGRRGR